MSIDESTKKEYDNYYNLAVGRRQRRKPTRDTRIRKEYQPPTQADETDRSATKPPILEVYGKLEGATMDAEGQGYIIVKYTKKNREQLHKTIKKLRGWSGKDIYLQFRQMYI